MEQDQSCTDTVIKGQHLTASVTNTRALWLLKSQDSLQWRWTMFVMQCEAKTPGWGRDRPPPRTTETRRCFALVRNVWGLLGPMTSHGVWWPILDLKKWIAWSQFYLAIHVTERKWTPTFPSILLFCEFIDRKIQSLINMYLRIFFFFILIWGHAYWF